MFRRQRRTWSFHVVVLQRTEKKCTIYNARAELLFCSLNLWFRDLLVAVFVVFCLIKLPCRHSVAVVDMLELGCFSVVCSVVLFKSINLST